MGEPFRPIVYTPPKDANASSEAEILDPPKPGSWNEKRHWAMKWTARIGGILAALYKKFLVAFFVAQLSYDAGAKPIPTYDVLWYLGTLMVMDSLSFVWRTSCGIGRMCEHSKASGDFAPIKKSSDSAWPPSPMPYLVYFIVMGASVTLYTLANLAFAKTNDADVLFGTTKYEVFRSIYWLTILNITFYSGFYYAHYYKLWSESRRTVRMGKTSA